MLGRCLVAVAWQGSTALRSACWILGVSMTRTTYIDSEVTPMSTLLKLRYSTGQHVRSCLQGAPPRNQSRPLAVWLRSLGPGRTKNIGLDANRKSSTNIPRIFTAGRFTAAFPVVFMWCHNHKFHFHQKAGVTLLPFLALAWCLTTLHQTYHL